MDGTSPRARLYEIFSLVNALRSYPENRSGISIYARSCLVHHELSEIGYVHEIFAQLNLECLLVVTRGVKILNGITHIWVS